MTLIATIAGENSNAYYDVATINAFLALRTYATAWTSLTTNDPLKEQHIITVTRRLEKIRDFAGFATTLSQSLLFPRTDIPKRGFREDRHLPDTYIFYDPMEMPPPLLEATAELCLHNFVRGTDPSLPNALLNFKSIRLPGLSFEPRGEEESVAPDQLPTSVTRALRLLRDVRKGGVRFARA